MRPIGMSGWRRAAVAVVVALAVAASVHAARDAGAFGCGYRDRDRTASWLLSSDSPVALRVRIGEAVLLAAPGGGALHDVTLRGSAALAPGTQNGDRGYVFRVTATGAELVRAKSDSGRVVTGTLHVTC